MCVTLLTSQLPMLPNEAVGIFTFSKQEVKFGFVILGTSVATIEPAKSLNTPLVVAL